MSAASSRVVDGVEIPERLIAEEAQNHPAGAAADAHRAAAHALAIRALLLDRARALGLTPARIIEDDGRELTPEEAMIDAVLDAEVAVESPDEAVCRRVYDTRPTDFCSPSLSEASHILVAPEADTDEAWEAARVRARDLIVRLADAEARFADLARAHSSCPSASVGGSLGQVGPGDLAAPVEAGLAALAPGEVSAAPVRSRFGWHVLRLDRRIEGRLLPFEQVRDSIAVNLEARAWTAAAARYVAGLAAEAREKGVALRLEIDGRLDDAALSLGDLLRDDAGVSNRVEAWLDEADPELAERARAAARAQDLEVADFVRNEITAFVGTADDEAWTRLISAAQGAEDPALGCVRAILKGRLEPPTRSYTLFRRT